MELAATTQGLGNERGGARRPYANGQRSTIGCSRITRNKESTWSLWIPRSGRQPRASDFDHLTCRRRRAARTSAQPHASCLKTGEGALPGRTSDRKNRSSSSTGRSIMLVTSPDPASSQQHSGIGRDPRLPDRRSLSAFHSSLICSSGPLVLNPGSDVVLMLGQRSPELRPLLQLHSA